MEFEEQVRRFAAIYNRMGQAEKRKYIDKVIKRLHRIEKSTIDTAVKETFAKIDNMDSSSGAAVNASNIGRSYRPSKQTRNFFKSFFENRMNELSHEKCELYDAMAALMDIDVGEQEGLKRFNGSYGAYREGSLDSDTGLNGIVRGDIFLQKYRRLAWFWHHSPQEIEGRSREFLHEGPAFAVRDRIYLIGVGHDEESAGYLRQMTLKKVNNPSNEVIPGMVITERAIPGNPPLAAKTILCRADCSVIDDDDDDTIRRQFDIFLEYGKGENPQARATIYGWDRSTELD